MDIKTAKEQFEEFVEHTAEARKLCERDRDYIDHKQWTDREVQVLRSRNQKAVVVNKVKKKHNFLSGLEIRGRTDPKAFPRTPGHEDDADAITDALRFVQDNGKLDSLFTRCFDEYICEGHEAVIIEVSGPKREIKPRRIPWDRFYFDPHSREHDFTDAKYLGVTVWVDRDDLARMFPDKKDSIMQMGDTPSLEQSFQDRPLWFDKTGRGRRTRVRFNEHYYLEGGEWKLVFFAGDMMLTDAETSPFLDDDGVPTCPIVAQSAYVDRENNRYGVVRGDISIQDEINKRRSKALHMLSSRTVIREKGTVKSGTEMMKKLRTGDADIELQSEGRFEIDENNELSQGQLALYQDAKQEMDDSVVTAINPSGGESGRSKLVDRENDTDELATLFDGHREFKWRVYLQIWSRIKQFWTEERWVRVTDDEENVKFVGLNKPVTGRDVVAERYGIQVSDVEQFLAENEISLLPGQLDRVVGQRNTVSEMDLDVVLDESADVVTIQQEQFEVLARLAEVYGPQEVPFEEVLRLSALRNKDQYLERTKGNEEQRQAQAQQAQQIQQAQIQSQMQKDQAETAVKVSQARKNNADADQQQVETQLAIAGVEQIG